MRHHVTIFSTVALVASVCLPSSGACASPLLSGYGGPGAGAQQIIGAGLVNGGGRGGGPRTGSGGNGVVAGGGSRSGTEAGGASGSPDGGSPAAGSGPARPGTSGSARSGPARPGAVASAGSGASRSGRAGEAQGASASAGEPRAVLPSSTLGLSDAELLTALLIAAGLLLTAVCTLWLSHLKYGHENADTKLMNRGDGR